MKLPVIKYALIAVLVTLSFNCGGSGGKQDFVDEYTEVLSQFMSRSNVIKKGQEAVIAYRRSNFNDVNKAETARENFLQGMSIDSAAILNLKSIDAPDSASREILFSLNSGIKAVSQGTAVFADNYSNTRDQYIEQRRMSLMNVRPGLVNLGRGYNLVVQSINDLREYIKTNALEESIELRDCFEYFERERDNLSGFLKE